MTATEGSTAAATTSSEPTTYHSETIAHTANAVDRRASVTGPAPRSPVQGLGAGRGTGDEEPADEVPVTDDGPIVGTVVSSRPADDPEHREAS